MLKKMMAICFVIAAVGVGMTTHAEKITEEIKSEIYTESTERRLERETELEEAYNAYWTSDYKVCDEGNGNYWYAYDVHAYCGGNKYEYTIYDIYNNCEYVGTLYDWF